MQATFAAHMKEVLGWETVYAFNDETFGRAALWAARIRLKPYLPAICAPHCNA